MSCRCPKTIAFLRFIGAQHAAMMHEHPDHAWTANDWLLHMAEEEDLLFPRFPSDVASQLGDDHTRYRDQIRKVGRILESTEQHSDVEDAWIGVIIARGP